MASDELILEVRGANKLPAMGLIGLAVRGRTQTF
jgi:hypothetical protein